MDKILETIGKLLTLSDGVSGRRMARLSLVAVMLWVAYALWEKRESVGVVVLGNPTLMTVLIVGIVVMIVGLWIEGLASRAQSLLSERISTLEARVKELEANERMLERRVSKLVRQIIKLGHMPEVTGWDGPDV